MTATMMDQTLFENAEWRVTDEGLEHRRTGYFIERAGLAQRRDGDLWAWPLHMAEKSWCAMGPFTEAFLRATSFYGVRADAGLDRSFELAQGEIASWPQAVPARPATPLRAPNRAPNLLRNEAGIPISMKPEHDPRRLPGGARKAPVQHQIWHVRTSLRSHASSSAGSGRGHPSATDYPWRKPHHFRKAGSRLVELLQAAWTTR
ncbi:hypothetical protein [Microvirga pudoricolor]|uniref:hypothetical protein n=1 Tax=Microvirga pudoricolor TaxID=2778729 RepID=UPI0019522376|nr:hypothetical protein [Microvirga pudoricolor]MBM6594837.1 hypothetical protein [Microvirga pudoricolor]